MSDDIKDVAKRHKNEDAENGPIPDKTIEIAKGVDVNEIEYYALEKITKIYGSTPEKEYENGRVRVSGSEVIYYSTGWSPVYELPPEIGDLKNLEVLSMFDSKLESLPDEICSLTNLRELYIPANNITSLPEEIGKMVLLERLDITNNQISELPVSVCNLERLKRFDATKNDIKSLPDNFGQLSSLEEVRLGYNEIIDLPVSMSGMSLNKLDLDGNSFVKIPDVVYDIDVGEIKILINTVSTEDNKRLEDVFGDSLVFPGSNHLRKAFKRLEDEDV